MKAKSICPLCELEYIIEILGVIDKPPVKMSCLNCGHHLVVRCEDEIRYEREMSK